MGITPAPESPFPFPRLNSTSWLLVQLWEEPERGERLELIRGSRFALVWDKDVSF